MGPEVVLLFFAAVFGSLIFVGLPVGLYYQQERRKLELEHAERIKAIELGRSLPGETANGAWSIPSKLAASVGVGVPISVFGCATVASMATGFHEGIWIATAMVGLGSVLCGTILAGQAFGLGKSSRAADSKPMIPEDAYDVVGSRG